MGARGGTGQRIVTAPSEPMGPARTIGAGIGMTMGARLGLTVAGGQFGGCGVEFVGRRRSGGQ